MDKEEERIMKLFEEASSGSSVHDPFSDDGQCGSDEDYDPRHDDVSSDNSAYLERKNSRNKTCLGAASRSQPPVSTSCSSSSSSSLSSDVESDTNNIRPQNVQISEAINDRSPNVQSFPLLENVASTLNDSTSCESTQSEILLQPNTTLPIDNNVPNIPIQDPAPSTSNSSQRHFRPVTPRDIINWENTTADIPEFDFDFTSTGVQFPINDNISVIDVFKQVFPPQIVHKIIDYTNAYGKALCNKNRPMTRNSRRYLFKDMDEREFYKFLGLCLLQGQISIPKKRKLFTYSDILYYHPIFPYTMSQRRFEQILRCICASDLNAKGSAKINNFISDMCRVFQSCYKPTKELSLDESLLLFRGRLKFRQYIKGKKAKYGIKFYELATADGFVLNIMMYSGKNNEPPERGKITQKIVLHLMRPYLLKGHELYMDNYYNSVTLSERLLDLKTHSNGTLRTNRKDNPKEIISKKIKKGQHIWARKNKIYVSKWVDKRPVHMITTLNHPRMVTDRNRYGQTKHKPLEVATYNKYMSGVDRSDQMVCYYSSPSKTVRWYKKVLFHILDVAVWNSFFIYKKYVKQNAKSYGLVDFREKLILTLIDIDPTVNPGNLIKYHKYDNRIKIRAESVPSSSSNLQAPSVSTGHWPEKIPMKNQQDKKSTFLKCKMCTRNKLRRESSYRCKGCPDKPALCPSCFEDWHNEIATQS